MKVNIGQIRNDEENLEFSYKIRVMIADSIEKEFKALKLKKVEWLFNIGISAVKWEPVECDCILTSKRDNLKAYNIYIPIDAVKKYKGNKNLCIVELILEGIKLLVEDLKLKPEVFDAIKANIDLNKIKDLPYPAPFNEQRMSTDPLGTELTKKRLGLP